MTLKLLNTETLIAGEDMECNGIGSYFDVCKRYIENKEDFQLIFPKDIIVIAENRKNQIKSGMKYIEREFVDLDGGEQYFLNVLPEVDKVCLRNNIYRPIFSSLLKQ